jgi:DNA polymerase III subunit delta
MEMDDKNRFERLTETLGEHCGMVELARVNEEDAMRWAVATAQEAGARLEPDAARELVDALGADMMLISSELEKLLLYTWAAAASRWATWKPWCWRQAALALRADRRHQRPRPRARPRPAARPAEQLRRRRGRGHRPPLHAGPHLPPDAGDSGKNVRDSRAIWQALWQGFRMPPFAADDLIRQARRYKSRRELTRALRLVARADLELRSSPPDKRLVLERLVYELASRYGNRDDWASRCNSLHIR